MGTQPARPLFDLLSSWPQGLSIHFHRLTVGQMDGQTDSKHRGMDTDTDTDTDGYIAV